MIGDSDRSPLASAIIFSIAGLICLYLILPSLIVVPMSFNAEPFISFPPHEWSIRWYTAYFEQPAWWGATLRSIFVGLVVMVLATVLGVLAAYGLVRGKTPFRSVVVVVLLLPMIVPTIVTAVGLYGFFARIGIVGTLAGLIVSHTVIALPFTVINAAAMMQRMDWRMEQASRSLGASALTTFVLVTLPILRPGIIAAAVFAFITSFDEVVVTHFIAGTGSVTLPVMMWSGLQFELNPIVASASTLLVGFSVLALAVSALLRKKEI